MSFWEDHVRGHRYQWVAGELRREGSVETINSPDAAKKFTERQNRKECALSLISLYLSRVELMHIPENFYSTFDFPNSIFSKERVYHPPPPLEQWSLRIKLPRVV
jgi:hypothetical protein